MASWTVEEKQIPEQHLLSIRLNTKEDQVRTLLWHNIELNYFNLFFFFFFF